MNRKRLTAALLALLLLAAVMPHSARAQADGGAVSVVFTGKSDFSGLLLLDEYGNRLFPLSDEGNAYLLSPGSYLYQYSDEAGNLTVVPLKLDGTETQVEIPLSPAEAPNSSPLFAPAEENPAEEQPAEEPLPMPVIFRCSEPVSLETLTVTDEAGTIMQPYMDPLTGAVQYENYLLLPGPYAYRLQDRRFERLEGSFTVRPDGAQVVTLTLNRRESDNCFTATAVNPLYVGLIREDSIPTPTVTPEESLTQLLRDVEVEELSRAGGRRTVYYSDALEGQAAELNTPVVYDNPEAAGAALKRALLQRQREIPIRIRTGVEPTKQIWWDTAFLIYDVAIRHSGAPTEGDYLRYEYGGVTCNGSVAETGEDGVYYYSFVYSPLYFTTLQQEAELSVRVDAILNELMLIGKSDEEKIRAVYRYLCDNVSYETASDTMVFTAYDALINGRAACQGVSVAFYRLCLELGLDARVVTSKELGHAWNIVRADGRRYYALDATWESGNGPEQWKYYLKGRETWLKEHTLGDEFADGRFAAYDFPEADYGAGTDVLIHRVSLLFDGMLRIKYYFTLPESLTRDQNACVVFSRGGETAATVPLSEARREGEYSCFYCGVNVSQIADPIQARIRLGDGSYPTIGTKSGTSYPNGFFFSPMEYARQMKDSASSAEMRALAQALEDYGLAAQNYFRKSGETLRGAVTAVSASQLEQWANRTEGEKPAGFINALTSVMFEADNSLRLYLNFEEGSGSGFAFEIDGRPAQLRENGEGKRYLSVDNIAADALDTPHSFVITDGNRQYTITSSVLGYCKSAIERGDADMANLGRALYLYNRAAEGYFGAGIGG